jgi:parvulin-like peptidyl-prolyl isomerase
MTTTHQGAAYAPRPFFAQERTRMSKHSEQTTGMPKTGKKPGAQDPNAKPKPRLLGEYKSRHEREAVIQRYINLGLIIIGVLAAILVAIALISEQVIRPNQPVATVNGENITVAQFERRVRLERVLNNQRLTNGYLRILSFTGDPQQAQQQLLQTPPWSDYYNEMSVPDQLGNRVLNDMIDDTLIRQQASARGITVTDEQIDEQARQFFGFDPDAILFTATPSVTPTSSPTPFITATASPIPSSTPLPSATPTPDASVTPTVTAQPSATATVTLEPTLELGTREAEYNTNRQDFNNFVNTNARLSPDELRSFFETLAIRQALQDQLTTEQPRTALFANIRHILVTSEEEAQDVLAALQAGESFRNLAAAVSQDQSNANNGGELGWAPLSNYVTAFADAARDAEIDAFVGPIETEFGWHILQVRAREDRALSDEEFEQAKSQAFSTWLDGIRTENEANTQRFDAWVDNVPTDPPLQLLTDQ